MMNSDEKQNCPEVIQYADTTTIRVFEVTKPPLFIDYSVNKNVR